MGSALFHLPVGMQLWGMPAKWYVPHKSMLRRADEVLRAIGRQWRRV